MSNEFHEPASGQVHSAEPGRPLNIFRAGVAGFAFLFLVLPYSAQAGAILTALDHSGSISKTVKDTKANAQTRGGYIDASAFRGEAAVGSPDTASTQGSIPWSQVGAKAGADYKGDGLAVSPTAHGARLWCVFQRLGGEATREGLWLTSTATNAVNDRFRVIATEVGRSGAPRSDAALPETGKVSIDGQTVRFTRPRLVEEYNVSMDGVRQDFVVLAKPGGASVPASRLASPALPTRDELRVELEVTGASVESVGSGAQLVLPASGRKIAYRRLRVTDAMGKELPARMEVVVERPRLGRAGGHPASQEGDAGDAPIESARKRSGAIGGEPQAAPETVALRGSPALLVLVDDAEAVYPVRIDPTFSDANWISMGDVLGANSDVSAAVADASGNLYIGGNFTLVGNTFANRIAKWNGTSWSALGSGMDDQVKALEVAGNDLYAGGFFTTAGGNAATNIAKWNGSSWSAVGSGMNGFVFALAVSGSDLYAGGYFTTAGGNAATNIAKWNGSSWSAVGSGLGSGVFAIDAPVVYALAVSGSDLYAGGKFTTAGGGAASYVAGWNGSSWSALGSGIVGAPDENRGVFALAVSGNDLYVGGRFTTAGGSAARNIAKWNGTSWSVPGLGIDRAVYALAVAGSDLYAGGEFTRATNSDGLAVTVNGIAKWNGSSWGAPGSGMGGGDPYTGPAVHALAVSGSDLYAGGGFQTAGGNTALNIAQWNGSSWSPLATGMDGLVHALAVSGSDLYVGGLFTTVGGIPANNIAKWNGSSWSPLGEGMNYGVWALAVSGSDLYAGGLFSTAGGSAATNIAKWNGSSWSALGEGMDGTVLALAVSGSDLYAGGAFTTAAGIPANYIAKWNGSGWNALGSGMDAVVWALAVSGGDLYAGGDFTTAGALPANYIAKWNGSSWSALGSGMGIGFPGVPSVWALAVSGSELYAGGVFSTAGGTPANCIARWDGSSWTALGSGIDRSVYAVAVSGSDLYAGGDFITAGGKVSPYLARADLAEVIDSDGDGVPDAHDQCPNTPPGEIVDAHGCSLGQLVPCAGPVEGGAWRNHGQYVSAVAQVAQKLFMEGLFTQRQRDAAVQAAAHSDCGKKR